MIAHYFFHECTALLKRKELLAGSEQLKQLGQAERPARLE